MMDMSQILSRLVEALDEQELRIVDLTQPLGPETPVIDLPPPFAPSPGVTIREISRYDDGGPAWYWNALEMGEHTGTHFDAPVHWITGREVEDGATDTIPPDRFVRPACVIDVSEEASRDPDYLLTPERIEAWEGIHGRIPGDAWLFMRTDWSRRTDPLAFLNPGEDGPHTPGFSPEASRLLAHDRDVVGVGVETVGTDAGQAGDFDPPFPNHHIMHGAGKFGLASLRNLDRLPPTGSVVFAAPLKIVGGSGSPLRVVAIVPA